jgi:hypothetical protein
MSFLLILNADKIYQIFGGQLTQFGYSRIRWNFSGCDEVTGPILQADQSKILIAIEYLVSGLTGNPEFPTDHGHLFAILQAGYKFNTFIHTVTLIPGHLGIPQMQ